ncbi:hypothetical protein NCLIV_015250 [Neospora caninum Liverpool]|uniref:SacI homology domain-containing protein n=1 Tax=Neospora caninum (strain Liverpool) TaxID=572307 RepID=F0VCP3_NEOCL|nr:hypothetical protein NCLIV_015250 [Neospora caninum Liverpool]CBZ51732.1 hypothetical protein NCLIV_015250 [Neospora caninum Liverpool]CEL65688.1 TPA: SacI homology domain-containing protein [Neospora caninum Liverpool]|eukprot:XP_003881765.1 hypothetical protein NCLIV_015250 [Neospora caninum Liverpool]
MALECSQNEERDGRLETMNVKPQVERNADLRGDSAALLGREGSEKRDLPPRMCFLGSKGGAPVDEDERGRILHTLEELCKEIDDPLQLVMRDARGLLGILSLVQGPRLGVIADAEKVTVFLGVHDIFRVKKTEFLPLFTTAPIPPNLHLYIHLALCSPSRSFIAPSSLSSAFPSPWPSSRDRMQQTDVSATRLQHLASASSDPAKTCICGGNFHCLYTRTQCDTSDPSRNAPRLCVRSPSESSSSSSPSLPPLRSAVRALKPPPVQHHVHAAAQALDQKFEGLFAAFSLEKTYFFCPSFFLCLPLQQVAARACRLRKAPPRQGQERRAKAGRQRQRRCEGGNAEEAGAEAHNRATERACAESKPQRETETAVSARTGRTPKLSDRLPVGQSGDKGREREATYREKTDGQDEETDEERGEDDEVEDAYDEGAEGGISVHDFLACSDGEEGEESSLRKEERRFVWNYELMKPFLAQGPAGFECLRRGILLPILHGFVRAASLAVSRGTVRLLLIARRSAFFAGTRSLLQRYGAPIHVLNLLKRRLPPSAPSSLSACPNRSGERPDETQSEESFRQSRSSSFAFFSSALLDVESPRPSLGSPPRSAVSPPYLHLTRQPSLQSSSVTPPMERDASFATCAANARASLAGVPSPSESNAASESDTVCVGPSPTRSRHALRHSSSCDLPHPSLSSAFSSASATFVSSASSSFTFPSASSSSLQAAVGAAIAAGRKGAGYERREEQEGDLGEVYRQLVDDLNEELPHALRIHFHWIDLKRQQYRRPAPLVPPSPSPSFPSPSSSPPPSPASGLAGSGAREGRAKEACLSSFCRQSGEGKASFFDDEGAQRRDDGCRSQQLAPPFSKSWKEPGLESREKERERQREREREREEEESLTPYRQLQVLGDELLNTVGVFYTNDPITLEATCVQRGVCRINCLDCLDRTNDAQLVLHKHLLLHLLRAMRFLPADSADLDPQVAAVLSGLLEAAGDQIALQYGGSNAHKKQQLLSSRASPPDPRHPSPPRLLPLRGQGPAAFAPASAVAPLYAPHAPPSASSCIRVSLQRDAAETPGSGLSAWVDSVARAFLGWGKRRGEGDSLREPREEEQGTPASPLFFLSLVTSVKRRYHNVLADGGKQQVVNLVQSKLHPVDVQGDDLASLDVDADAWLHHEWIEPSFDPQAWWVLPLQRFFNAMRLATSSKTLLLPASPGAAASALPSRSLSLSSAPRHSCRRCASRAHATWRWACPVARLDLDASLASPWFDLFGGSLQPPLELRFPLSAPRASLCLRVSAAHLRAPLSSCFSRSPELDLRDTAGAAQTGASNSLECIYTYQPWLEEAEVAGERAAELARDLLRPRSSPASSHAVPGIGKESDAEGQCATPAEGRGVANRAGGALHEACGDEPKTCKTETPPQFEDPSQQESEASVEPDANDSARLHGVRAGQGVSAPGGPSRTCSTPSPSSREVSPFRASFCLLLPSLFLRPSGRAFFSKRRRRAASAVRCAKPKRGAPPVPTPEIGFPGPKLATGSPSPKAPVRYPSLSSLPSFSFSFSAFPSFSSFPFSFASASASYLSLHDIAEETVEGEQVLVARFLEDGVSGVESGDEEEEETHDNEDEGNGDAPVGPDGSGNREGTHTDTCEAEERSARTQSRRRHEATDTEATGMHSAQETARASRDAAIGKTTRLKERRQNLGDFDLRRRAREERAVHFRVGDTPSLGGFLPSHPSSSLLPPSRPSPFSSLEVFQAYQSSLVCPCGHAAPEDEGSGTGDIEYPAGGFAPWGKCANTAPRPRALTCHLQPSCGPSRDMRDSSNVTSLSPTEKQRRSSELLSRNSLSSASSVTSPSARRLRLSPVAAGRPCASPFCLWHWGVSPSQALAAFAEARRARPVSDRQHASSSAPEQKRRAETAAQQRPREETPQATQGAEKKAHVRERKRPGEPTAPETERGRESEEGKNGREDEATECNAKAEERTETAQKRATDGDEKPEGILRNLSEKRKARTLETLGKRRPASGLFLPTGCQVRRGTRVFDSSEDGSCLCFSGSNSPRIFRTEEDVPPVSLSRLSSPLGDSSWRSGASPDGAPSGLSHSLTSLSHLWRRDAAPAKDRGNEQIGTIFSPLQWPLLSPREEPNHGLASALGASPSSAPRQPAPEERHSGCVIEQREGLSLLSPVSLSGESGATREDIPYLFGEEIEQKKNEFARLLSRAETSFALVHGW